MNIVAQLAKKKAENQQINNFQNSNQNPSILCF